MWRLPRNAGCRRWIELVLFFTLPRLRGEYSRLGAV
jgi:hypothetical protein